MLPYFLQCLLIQRFRVEHNVSYFPQKDRYFLQRAFANRNIPVAPEYVLDTNQAIDAHRSWFQGLEFKGCR